MVSPSKVGGDSPERSAWSNEIGASDDGVISHFTFHVPTSKHSHSESQIGNQKDGRMAGNQVFIGIGLLFISENG
jgi:hypothetical protein